MAGKISGFAVAYTALGGLLIYSGIKGTSLTTTFTDLTHGTLDSTPEASAVAAGASDPGAAAVGPAVPSAGSLTIPEMQTLWVTNGGDSATSWAAANIGDSESGGRPAVTSGNPDGGTNVGIWQLDTKGVGAGYTVAELSDPDTNARITIMATANGTNWAEWADPDVSNGAYTGPSQASSELTS